MQLLRAALVLLWGITAVSAVSSRSSRTFSDLETPNPVSHSSVPSSAESAGASIRTDTSGRINAIHPAPPAFFKEAAMTLTWKKSPYTSSTNRDVPASCTVTSDEEPITRTAGDETGCATTKSTTRKDELLYALGHGVRSSRTVTCENEECASITAVHLSSSSAGRGVAAHTAARRGAADTDLVGGPTPTPVTKDDIDRVRYHMAQDNQVSADEWFDMGEFFADANYVCETTSGSPLSKDVQVAANNMKGWPAKKNCPQTKPYDGSCTNHSVHRTARIATCGKYLHGMKCNWVVWAAQLLITSCSKRIDGETRVGGQVFRSHLVKIVLIRN